MPRIVQWWRAVLYMGDISTWRQDCIASGSLDKGCTNPGRRFARTAKYCTVAPNICRSSVWNFIVPFWRPELWAGSQISRKCLKLYSTRWIKPSNQLITNNNTAENVECFKYLGSMSTYDRRCTCEIKSKIAMEKAAFNKRKTLFTGTFRLNLR